MFYVREQDLCVIAAKLTEVVKKRYFETISLKEKAELQAAIAKELRETLESMQEKVGEEPGISY